jgi:hypothetical protein
MKKYILSFLFALSLATTFSACTDEEVKPQADVTAPGGGASDGKN